jgi:spore germination cell wall hydrolase CwlJ-like protein
MSRKSLITALTGGLLLAGNPSSERMNPDYGVYSPSITTSMDYSNPAIEDQPDQTNILLRLKMRSGTNTLDLNDPLTLLAVLAYEEAGVCSKFEKIEVIHTVMNRLKERKYGKTIREVVFEPNQYSFINFYNPIRGKRAIINTTNAQKWEDCLDAAEGVLSGRYSDPTNGATHYFNPLKVKPLWRHKLEKIGKIKNGAFQSRHVFYREVIVPKSPPIKT